MKLSRYTLGDLLTQRREKNQSLSVPVKGVSKEGFINPKQLEADLSLYNVFYKNDFVFNPARMELNSISFNRYLDKAICSSLYEIFYVKRTDILLPEYLNIFIKRTEFARKCWFEAVGSARNYFRFNDLCEFSIDLPTIEVQQKAVDVYLALLANQKVYEKGLDDLKIAYESYIEDLRRKIGSKYVGKYLNERLQKNSFGKYKNLVGLGKAGFIKPNQERTNESLKKCNIFYHNDFVYAPSSLVNGVISISNFNDPMICTEEYIVFYSNDLTKLIPEYLLLWAKRSEFGRRIAFNSLDSVRNRYYFQQLKEEIFIPLPSIKIQEDILEVYRAYKMRYLINEKLKNSINEICPILIKGSIGYYK
jgi:type I restriction enzyme S subunit